jgi:NAD(P)-dependent dehydrogenase (short-subunit alcohol dehydrogenase family)
MAIEMVRHDIRVNALCPGWFLTELNSDYFTTESGKRYINNIPMKRLGRIEELTVPLLLLVSDAGSYMTGTTLTVDGGILESPI